MDGERDRCEDVASSVSEAFPPALASWSTLSLLLLVSVVSLLDRNIITLLVDYIKGDLGLTDVEISYILGPAFALSYVIGAVPFGAAMDRYSRRLILSVGLATWSLGTMALGLARNFGELFAARFALGAGESVLTPGGQSIIPDLFPRDRLGFAFSVYTTGSKIGHGLSLVVGGLLTLLIIPASEYEFGQTMEFWGWQVIFMVVGVPGLLLCFFIFAIPEPVRQLRMSSGSQTIGYNDYLAFAWKRRRFFVNLHLGGVFGSMVFTGLLAWMPVFFTRFHGWPVDRVGVWLGGSVVLGPLIALPIHGLVSDRLCRLNVKAAHTRYVCFALLASAPLFASGYLVESAWVALSFFCVAIALFSALTSLMPTALQLMVPGSMRGKAASVLLVLSTLLGVSVGPTLVAGVSAVLFSGPGDIGFASSLCASLLLPLTALLFYTAEFRVKSERVSS